jgi:hypothetical protein
MGIKRVIIYVELENGQVHQVLTQHEIKMYALELIKDQNGGSLPVSSVQETVEFEE